MDADVTVDGAAAPADTSAGIPAVPAAPTGTPADTPTSTTESPDRFLNRELSWLDFADRLLDLAEDHEVPLLERVKFVAIWSSGMDEFFQVRVAGLKDQVAAGLRASSPDGMTPSEQLSAIGKRCRRLIARQDENFTKALVPELAEAGVDIVTWDSLASDERAALLAVFERDIFPVLTPLAVDPGHPFPYISNLSLNLGVLVSGESPGVHRFARVKVPPLLSRFVQVGEKARFVGLEDVIAANLDRLFPQMSLGGHYAFRVTRNADLLLEEGESDDLLAAVEVELRRRRFGRAVRLEVASSMPTEIRELLLEELELGSNDVYESDAPLDLAQLWEIHNLDRPDLRDPPWVPMTPPRLATPADDPVDLFAALREHDVLVHHPYDSFVTSVEAFLRQAARDPRVYAIKQTLYRTSDDTSVVSALVEAAERGKQVAALVEVKARFDEAANISWARELEQAGVHVVYGLVGLKTHSKTCLVVRREEDGLHRYCHIGTGNYNSEYCSRLRGSRAAHCRPAVRSRPDRPFQLSDGFYGRQSSFRRIVASPQGIRPWCLSEIEKEAALGEAGRITIKVNGLNDPGIIDALYGASRAGARIDLVVRGICCLRPGVPGLSETVRVRSIVGRFLEHSRIYRFGDPDSSHGKDGTDGSSRMAPAARYFIGSADLMERNLDRRVEVLAPVLEDDLRARLDETLELNLADDVSAWELGPDGSWHRVPTQKGVSTQRRLMELAVDAPARGGRLNRPA